MGRLPLSKGSLVVSTIASYLVFIIVVGYGWWALLVRSNTGAIYIALQVVLVGAIVVFATMMIRAIALLRAQAGSTKTWLSFWVIVWLLTAFGTVGAAFNWLESKAILRDDILMLQSRYDDLGQRAEETLATNRYQLEKQGLTQYLNELEQEIDESTGTRCGFGEKAAAALHKIGQIVPVARTSASVPLNPCNRERARLMYAPYPARAWQAFESKWRAPGNAERRKDELFHKIEKDRDSSKQELDDLAATADGFGSADSINNAPLLRALSRYNGDLQSLSEFEPDVLSMPGKIGGLQSTSSGSYAGTFELIFRRIGKGTTLLYIAIALLIDFVLISLLTQMARRYAKEHSAGVYSAEDRAMLIKLERDPRFLWRSPFSKSRGR
ncbi:MAG: hypothetical protein WC804_21540 [Sphingomonas sp.]|jgi:hypothetical protein|uniref:hypothetical protein n=1 Tax=Sphingomonas sp. TaxID=28214 RepID=UPI0035618A14